MPSPLVAIDHSPPWHIAMPSDGGIHSINFLASLSGEAPCCEAPCCVILDHQMPDMDGLDVLRRIRDIGSDVPVIIVTGFDQPGMSEQCHRAGAAAYLTKPVGSSEVRAAIELATGE